MGIVEFEEQGDRRIRRDVGGFRCRTGRPFFVLLPLEGVSYPDFAALDENADYWVSFDGLPPEAFTLTPGPGDRLVLPNAKHLLDKMTQHDRVSFTPDSIWWNPKQAGWWWAAKMPSPSFALSDIRDDLNEFRDLCVASGQ